MRENLQQALELLQEAGCKLEGNKLVDQDGKPFTVEFLLNGPTIERVALPYQQGWRKIGIDDDDPHGRHQRSTSTRLRSATST